MNLQVLDTEQLLFYFKTFKRGFSNLKFQANFVSLHFVKQIKGDNEVIFSIARSMKKHAHKWSNI